jgi:cation diffusion facilitator CzcD-associated flavoprotein CzcO
MSPPSAYSYQFSFAPSPYWSSLYAPGLEIRRYMQDVAERYGAMRFIKVSHAVQSCTWDEILRKWFVLPKMDRDDGPASQNGEY